MLTDWKTLGRLCSLIGISFKAEHVSQDRVCRPLQCLGVSSNWGAIHHVSQRVGLFLQVCWWQRSPITVLS